MAIGEIMSTHFEYVECLTDDSCRPTGIGCGVGVNNTKTRTLDKVTCGRCRRSRPYKVCRAFLLDLIDKKMLNKLGFCAPKKL